MSDYFIPIYLGQGGMSAGMPDGFRRPCRRIFFRADARSQSRFVGSDV